MRNQDDLPYIVVERDSGGSFGSFCLGALVGAGLALLFAPQSGEETQEEIRARAKKLRIAAACVRLNRRSETGWNTFGRASNPASSWCGTRSSRDVLRPRRPVRISKPN